MFELLIPFSTHIFTITGLIAGLNYVSIAFIQSNSNLPTEESSAPQQVPEHHVREAINPRTGRRERVFVDLKAVYPDRKNPAHEVSFEELRAMKRGWMSKNWKAQKEPLQQISGNASGSESQTTKPKALAPKEDLRERAQPRPDVESQASHDDESHEGKTGKAKKFKVQGETQTSTNTTRDGLMKGC